MTDKLTTYRILMDLIAKEQLSDCDLVKDSHQCETCVSGFDTKGALVNHVSKHKEESINPGSESVKERPKEPRSMKQKEGGV